MRLDHAECWFEPGVPTTNSIFDTRCFFFLARMFE
jgi:hypothetical protein